MNLVEINKKLGDYYGRNLSGLPHFRVSFSNDLYETRVGKFNEFYYSIFLRTYIGPKKVLKYNYIRDRYILEMWRIEQTKPTAEVPCPDGYECVYVFEDKNGNALPVVWKVLELICFTILNPHMDSEQIKDAIDASQIKIEQDDIVYFEDSFRENSNYELHKRHHGERISNAGVKKDVN